MSIFRRKNDRSSGGRDGPFLVAGLGNPGEEYARTRHNAGFMVAQEFIRRHGLARPRRRYGGRYTEGSALGRDVAVIMPQTYMNLSGESVAEAAGKKHVPAERIIVIHDDLDFPFGTVRCRIGGGSGGHNGVSSVSRMLGTPDYNRVRVGIGRPDDPAVDPRDWVLTPFEQSDDELAGVVAAATDCVQAVIAEGIEAAMARFNRRPS